MAQELVVASYDLPALRRINREPERLLYRTRPGFGALPSGLGISLVIVAPQFCALGFLFWAIWWPGPIDHRAEVVAWVWTALIALALVAVAVLVMHRFQGFVTAVLRAPFTSVLITDRRVLWTVPWTKAPLMEIGRHRILGALLGPVDRRGRGNAAMVLVDGDPAADVDGNIHFDRLPHAARFVAALSR